MSPLDTPLAQVYLLLRADFCIPDQETQQKLLQVDIAMARQTNRTVRYLAIHVVQLSFRTYTFNAMTLDYKPS
eukprot:4932046-Amphidinium_carterae.1